MTVLVIEAGKVYDGAAETVIREPNRNFNIPQTNPEMFWNDINVLPIESMNNRVAFCRAARLAGGGSAVNGMMFDRGSARDYDDWAEYIGDKNWGWKSLLESFKKLETFTPPTPEQVAKYGIEWDPAAHGTSGPINSGFPPLIADRHSKSPWSYHSHGLQSN